MWRAAVHLQVKVEGSFQKEAHLPCICWVLSISNNSRKEWDTGSNTFACHFCVMTAGLKVQAEDFRLTLKQVKHMNCVCAPWLTAVAAEGWSVKWRVSCLVLGFSFLFYSGSNAAWKKNQIRSQKNAIQPRVMTQKFTLSRLKGGIMHLSVNNTFFPRLLPTGGTTRTACLMVHIIRSIRAPSSSSNRPDNPVVVVTIRNSQGIVRFLQ